MQRSARRFVHKFKIFFLIHSDTSLLLKPELDATIDVGDVFPGRGWSFDFFPFMRR